LFKPVLQRCWFRAESCRTRCLARRTDVRQASSSVGLFVSSPGKRLGTARHTAHIFVLQLSDRRARPYTDRRQTTVVSRSSRGQLQDTVFRTRRQTSGGRHQSVYGSAVRAGVREPLDTLHTFLFCSSSSGGQVRTDVRRVRRPTTGPTHSSSETRRPGDHKSRTQQCVSSGLGQLNSAVHMEKQQDSNISHLSLDERFSEKGRRSSARLRHQSLDRGMDRPSLNRRFGGDEGEQLPMTAPYCRWVQASSTDRQPLDQRFSNGNHRLSASGLHHLKAAVERQDNDTGLQLPMTATTSHGQQARELPVAAVHGCNGHHSSSSHSTGASTNVDSWTSDELHHLSISASAGAQLRNTDKASMT